MLFSDCETSGKNCFVFSTKWWAVDEWKFLHFCNFFRDRGRRVRMISTKSYWSIKNTFPHLMVWLVWKRLFYSDLYPVQKICWWRDFSCLLLIILKSALFSGLRVYELKFRSKKDNGINFFFQWKLRCCFFNSDVGWTPGRLFHFEITCQFCEKS